MNCVVKPSERAAFKKKKSHWKKKTDRFSVFQQYVEPFSYSLSL